MWHSSHPLISYVKCLTKVISKEIDSKSLLGFGWDSKSPTPGEKLFHRIIMGGFDTVKHIVSIKLHFKQAMQMVSTKKY